jgi:hypothetical protein
MLIPIAVVLARRRRQVFLALAAIALVLVVQPYSWWSRFTIPWMAIGAIVIAAAATWAPRPWMRTAVRSGALILALAAAGLSSYKVDPAARARPLPAADLLGLVEAPPRERTLGRLFFPEYRFLEGVPGDATIVVDLHAPPVRFVYPLFGPEHTREVLPAGSGAPRAGAWIVTSAGRPLDRWLRADERFRLTFEDRGVRVWKPV